MHMTPATRQSRRPAFVTFLTLGVLTITVVNFIRLVQAAQQWKFLERLLPFSPLYLILAGSFWAVTGLILIIGLWLGRPWGRLFTILLSFIYTCFYWIDRLLLRNSEVGVGSLPFSIIVNIVLLLLILGALLNRRASVYFGDVNG